MFKCLWTDPAEMAVSAGAIVKHFDVVEDMGPGHITGLVYPPLDAFLFQTAEEGFGNGVIPAVSPSTHARLELVGFAKAHPVVAAFAVGAFNAMFAVLSVAATQSEVRNLKGG